MRLGLIARADNSGLGIQTHEFYRHMEPFKTMVVDISKMNGNNIYPERYPDAFEFVKGIPTSDDLHRFLGNLDVVFVAEAPYNYELYSMARMMGVKTAVQYNYEFFDWFAHPDYPKPDMLIAPSRWHYDDVNNWCETNKVQHIYLHCPVNREALPFREIRQARTFLHVAGRSAAHDRNGTDTVIRASRYLNTDAKIIIHFQGEQGLGHQATNTIDDYKILLANKGDPSKVTIQQIEYPNYTEVYQQGDVLLLPRRYGGNCLPLNEALSVGMPVIMTDIIPNRDFLPREWLLPAEKLGEFTPRTTIDIYGAQPIHLARAIDKFYQMSEAEMLSENVRASNVAETISWPNMKSQYQDALEALCTQ